MEDLNFTKCVNKKNWRHASRESYKRIKKEIFLLIKILER